MCSLHLVRSIHFAKHQADSHSIVLKIKWVLLLCALQFLLWMEWFRIFRKSLHWILASTRSSADGCCLSLWDDRHSTKLSDVCLVDLFTLPLHLGDIISRCHYHIFIAPSSNCPFQCCTCVTCVCVHVQRVSVFKPCPREYSSPCSYFSEKRSKRRKCLRQTLLVAVELRERTEYRETEKDSAAQPWAWRVPTLYESAYENSTCLLRLAIFFSFYHIIFVIRLLFIHFCVGAACRISGSAI